MNNNILITIVLFFSSVITNAENIKYASDYGFSVSNNGEDNAKALQSALNGGGKILVTLPGTYNLSKTVLIDSNTELFFSQGVVINKCADEMGQLTITRIY